MTLELNEVFFLILLPIISFLYASVGHGGASGYLALMALFSFPNEMMKQTALLLNLIVAGIAFTQYYRAGHFNKNLFLYFAIGSIPMAFIGGQWALDPAIYKKILGIFLFFAVLRMLFSTPKSLKNPNSIKTLNSLAYLFSENNKINENYENVYMNFLDDEGGLFINVDKDFMFDPFESLNDFHFNL